MTKVQSVFSKIFCTVFAVVFAWLSWLCLTESQLLWLFKGWVIGIAAVEAVICLGIYVICKYISKFIKRSSTVEIIVLLIAFAVYIYLQIFSAGNFYSRRGTSWDFNVVAGAAMDYVQLGELGGKYFRMWPNNIPLFLLLVAVFKPMNALGLDLNFVGIGLNIVAIDISFIFSYLILKKVTKSRTAGFIGLAILFLTLPFLTYVPIYYTDTLTLPFPVIIFYLWLIAKEKLDGENIRQSLIYMAVIGAVSAFGGTLKLSAMFMLLAVLADALLHVPFKKFLAVALVALVVFGVFNSALGYLCNNSSTLVEDEEEYYIPKLHWVMMGMRGKGNYYDDDYKLTLSVPAAERDALCWNETIARVKDYGVPGMLDHLHQKCAFVWAEGTYYSSLKLDRDRALHSIFDDYLIYIAPKFTYSAHYCQGLELLNLIAAVICAVRMIVSKSHKEPLFACCVSMFGLFLFECLWEARSRYIFNFVPVFIIITAVQLFDLYKYVSAKISKS